MSDAARVLFGESFATASLYVDLLSSRGIDWGVIGPREAPRLWDRHILNSAALSPLVPLGASVVDVGSGAGLPGIPLAIVRPDLTVTLLEPLERRAAFLAGVVEELGLTSRVTVVRGRAEDHHGTYQVVTSRAVAPLARLAGWCVPLIAPGGCVVALKGRSASEELLRDTAALRKLRVQGRVEELPVAGSEEPTWAIVVTRASGH